MEKLYIPQDLLHFVIITLFSLIIGLSQRHITRDDEEKHVTFGTDRTFTFIGILAYLLFKINIMNHALYLLGAVLVSIFLAIYYIFKIKYNKRYGITTIIIALITYFLPPILINEPFWFFMLVVVIILIFSELKETFFTFSTKFNKDEFITLGKFLVIAGVILPVVPDEPFVYFLTLTPYKIWMAVVIISTISYIGYLLRKFVFHESGIIITGILGGMYSSTATTIVLAGKAKHDKANLPKYAVAILLATTMMYLRVLLLMAIFRVELAIMLWPYFLFLALVSAGVPLGMLYFKRNNLLTSDTTNIDAEKNPLEFKVALLFTVLYVSFSFLTWYTISKFGSSGLTLLSYIVGVTDIDPFLINLFQGKYGITLEVTAIASLQSMLTNNIVKLAYAWHFSGRTMNRILPISFAAVIVMHILVIVIL